MVRISLELVEDSYQYINAVNQREISLREKQIPAVENLGVTRDFFDTIDLTDNHIRKLENLPVLKRLHTLLLHNNSIKYIQEDIGTALPQLQTLALTNNKLSELGDIDALAGCRKLEYLSLIGNTLCVSPDYRLYIIHKLPSVRVLDYRRVKLAERQEAAKKFKGKAGAKLRTELGKKSVLNEEEPISNKVKKFDQDQKETIKDSIKNAKTLEELNELQSMLIDCKIPKVIANQGEEPMDMS